MSRVQNCSMLKLNKKWKIPFIITFELFSSIQVFGICYRFIILVMYHIIGCFSLISEAGDWMPAYTRHGNSCHGDHYSERCLHTRISDTGSHFTTWWVCGHEYIKFLLVLDLCHIRTYAFYICYPIVIVWHYFQLMFASHFPSVISKSPRFNNINTPTFRSSID